MRPLFRVEIDTKRPVIRARLLVFGKMVIPRGLEPLYPA